MPTAAQQIEASGVPIPPVSSSSFDGFLSQMGGGSNDNLKKISADISAKDKELEEKSAPVLKELHDLKPPTLSIPPAPQQKQTDPWEAFGSPAMWIATFGSLLTRQPLTNALNAAAAVVNAQRAGDEAESKRQMEIWKINSENAIKLGNFEMDAYKAAIDKDKTEAGILTTAFRDTTKQNLFMAGLHEKGLKDYQDNLTKMITARDKITADLDKTQIRDETTRRGQDMRAETTERGQDIRAETSERGQDMKAGATTGKQQKSITSLIHQIDDAIGQADNSQTNVMGMDLAPTGLQGMVARTAEGLGVSEGDNAPATTFKTSIKLISDQAQRLLAGGRYSTKAATDMQSALASVGAVTSGKSSKAALAKLKSALEEMQSEDAKAKESSAEPSQEDLEFTAKKHGITVEEVKKRLGTANAP